jgi:hypothetical protein
MAAHPEHLSGIGTTRNKSLHRKPDCSEETTPNNSESDTLALAEEQYGD